MPKGGLSLCQRTRLPACFCNISLLKAPPTSPPSPPHALPSNGAGTPEAQWSPRTGCPDQQSMIPDNGHRSPDMANRFLHSSAPRSRVGSSRPPNTHIWFPPIPRVAQVHETYTPPPRITVPLLSYTPPTPKKDNAPASRISTYTTDRGHLYPHNRPHPAVGSHCGNVAPSAAPFGQPRIAPVQTPQFQGQTVPSMYWDQNIPYSFANGPSVARHGLTNSYGPVYHNDYSHRQRRA